jgi:hypothetical protein
MVQSQVSKAGGDTGKKGEQQNKGATGFKAGGKNEKLQLATREEPKLRRGERKARRESGKRGTKTRKGISTAKSTKLAYEDQMTWREEATKTNNKCGEEQNKSTFGEKEQKAGGDLQTFEQCPNCDQTATKLRLNCA